MRSCLVLIKGCFVSRQTKEEVGLCPSRRFQMPQVRGADVKQFVPVNLNVPRQEREIVNEIAVVATAEL